MISIRSILANFSVSNYNFHATEELAEVLDKKADIDDIQEALDLKADISELNRMGNDEGDSKRTLNDNFSSLHQRIADLATVRN